MSSLETLAKNNKPSAKTRELVQTVHSVLLVGPSGAGKDTAKNELLKTGDYYHIVSSTTRKPRVNNGKMEEDGLDYNFIDEEQAEKMVQNGDFIEVNVYVGNLYGTTAAELAKAKEQGKIATTDIDVNGVAKFMELAEDSGAVQPFFILPPSMDAWIERITSRGDLSREQLIKRGVTAVSELRTALKHDYYIFVINNSVDEMKDYTAQVAKSGKPDQQKQQQGRALAETLLQEATKILRDEGAKIE